MKHRRKASLEVDHTVPAQVLRLFIGHALQRLLRLHHRDGVREAFQVLSEAALIGTLVKPLRERRGVLGGETGVFRVFRQIDDGLRPQDAVEVLVEKNLG